MPAEHDPQDSALTFPAVTRREIFSWAMYDFANSGYTTVVLTAIFSAYFVSVVAGHGADDGVATLLWTIAMAVSNGLILVTAPVLGAIADAHAWKKRFLLFTTIGCVVSTALLALAGPGEVWFAMALVIVSAYMFGSGENLIAAFLPEIATQKNMGRISAYGWTLGYVGGLLVLAICLVIVMSAQTRGESAEHYVPITMLITAGAFALAALPTFLWLRERAVPAPLPSDGGYLTAGFVRLKQTWNEAHHFRDLTRFLVTLALYQCGVYTVIVLAAVYAQAVMGFSTFDNIVLILVVNITAALGAFGFGHIQDRLGSVPTLAMTLLLWIVALAIAYSAQERTGFWIAANFIGLAMGSSQSAGRALIGLFSPPDRAAEFFGLWGFAAKLAAIVGPLSYGVIAFATHGNHRMAVLATAVFFVAGLVMLLFVNEQRGRDAALANRRA